jgi:hypothetical protein
MANKPTNDAARVEKAGEPAPKGQGSQYRVKCTHAVDVSWAGWLDYSGPGNHLFLTGDPNTPGGMKFEDYQWSGRYLNPVGTYVGNDRYLGPNGKGDCQADWNLWPYAKGCSILWNGKALIQMSARTEQHLVDEGNGWVNWSGRPDTALNCEQVFGS